MQFNQQYTIEIPVEPLWETLMDVRQVAGCLEGVEELNVIDDDLYEGKLTVKMGAVKLRFHGRVTVTLRDHANRKGVLEAGAKDPKAGGGFKAALQMQLAETAPGTSELALDLEATILGRIGELGRPLIKKRINTMMDDFVEALIGHLAPEGAEE